MEHNQSTYLLTNILKCGNRPMIKLNDMAKRLGVSVNTLQRWGREGVLVQMKAYKTEIQPNKEQIELIHQTFNIDRLKVNQDLL